jgi:hypothetical protein
MAPFFRAPKTSAVLQKVHQLSETTGGNSDKNRRIFENGCEIVEFCPNFANSSVRQGNNSEFCGFLPNPMFSKALSGVSLRIQKKNWED